MTGLDPNISLPEIIKPYAEELIKKRYSPSTMAHELFDTVQDYVSLVRDFPAELNEILFRMKQGKLIFEIHVGEQEAWNRSVKSIGGTIAIAFLLGFLLIISVVMSVWGKSPALGNVMFGISGFFALWLLLRLFVKSSL